ncbi:hypothetical protein GAMM_120044 [Gammaproteobacteria bacterium]
MEPKKYAHKKNVILAKKVKKSKNKAYNQKLHAVVSQNYINTRFFLSLNIFLIYTGYSNQQVCSETLLC